MALHESAGLPFPRGIGCYASGPRAAVVDRLRLSPTPQPLDVSDLVGLAATRAPEAMLSHSREEMAPDQQPEGQSSGEQGSICAV
jgi:hypothetical protein